MKPLKTQFIQTVKVLALALIIGVGFNAFAATWTPPGDVPPYANTPAPINVGSLPQTRLAGLTVAAGGGITNGLIVANGKVGIGTLSPTQKLDVQGWVVARSGLCLTNDETVNCRSTWPSGGNVGLGTPVWYVIKGGVRTVANVNTPGGPGCDADAISDGLTCPTGTVMVGADACTGEKLAVMCAPLTSN